MKNTQNVSIDGTDKTYQSDQEGNWYDHAGNKVTDEVLLKKISDAVTVNAVLQADHEDLKELNGVVSFNDKQQHSAEFSGYGRVYLRKNEINGINLLTPAMFTQAKTRYIIQYDYDLNKTILKLPADVILDFQGGSIKNGEIDFNNTVIEASLYRIFRNVTYSGMLANNLFNAAWAFDNTNTEDNTVYLNSLIPVLSGTAATLKFHNGTYRTRYIELFQNTILAGNAGMNQSIIRYIGGPDADFVYAKAANRIYNNIHINGLQFEGANTARHIFNLSSIRDSVFENILSRECVNAHIYAHSSLNGYFTTYCIYNTFRNITCYNDPKTLLSKYGVRLVSATNSNRFYDCRISNAEIGIAVEDNIAPNGETFKPETGWWGCNNNIFVNCACEPTSEIAVYVNSESNVFLGMRLEGSKKAIVLGEGTFTRNNVFMGITIYAISEDDYVDRTIGKENFFLRRRGKGGPFYTENLEVDNLVAGLLKSIPSRNWVRFDGRDDKLSPFDIDGRAAVLRRNFKMDNGNDFQHVMGTETKGGLYERISITKPGEPGYAAHTRYLNAKGENPYWQYEQPVKLKVYPDKASVPAIMNGDPIGAKHKGLCCMIGNDLAVWNGSAWVTFEGKVNP